MVPITFTCILILITSGFFQDVVGSRPTLIPIGGEYFPEKGELLIQEGNELRLTCQGEGDLQFSPEKISEPTLEIEQSKYTVFFDVISGAYTFLRPSTTRQDTGWYACAKNDIDIKNDEQTIDHPSQNISWIYVYVLSSEPFAVMEAVAEPVLAIAGDDAVIPCRPTSPELLVILEGQDGIMTDAAYDPKIGFVLRDINKERSGEYTCKLNATDQLENDATPLYSLHVEDTGPLGTPTINEDALRHVVWGEDLTVKCTLVVQRRAKFNMNITVPNSVSPERLHYSHRNSLKNTDYRKEIWEVELNITNVQPSDAGEYICVVNGVRDRRTQLATNITVWDPNYTYVNVSLDGHEDILLWERDSVQWKIKIETYPKNFKCEWYKDGIITQLIKTTDVDPRSRFSHVENGPWHIFKISHLNIEDTGQYIIHVSTSHDEEKRILSLTVVGEPVVTVTNNWRYYLPGETEIFSVQIDGSPLPNVTWNYIEYPEFPSKEHSRVIPLSNTTTEKVAEASFRLMSRANLTINMSGDLVCRSCNTYNCSDSTQWILVSEVGDDFGIKYPAIVTEGDKIDVLCAASVYNYTGDITWKSYELNETKELDINTDGIHVIKRNSSFTWQAILHIPEVKKSHAGNYQCEARNEEGHSSTDLYELKVEAARLPVFTETNMNQSEIAIVLPKDKNRAIFLECHADGRPIPAITWYKNNEILKESKQYKYSANKTKLQISFFADADADSGRYSCKAHSRMGTIERYMDIKIAGKSDRTVLWISLICALIVIIVIVITYMGIRVHRERVLRKELLEAGLTHFEEGALECLNPDLTVDEQAELLPYDKKWEFPRELLKLGRQLGSGAFGVVMKAEARGICVEGETTTVAVKMVRRSADPSYMKALSSELKIMIHLGRHLNVVNLLGACTKTILTKRELYVIVEYCRFGNLHNYLQRHRATFIDQIDPATQKIDPMIGNERLARSGSVGSQNKLKYAALSFSRSISIKSSDSNSAGSEPIDYRQGQDFGDINMSPDGGVLSNNSIQPGWRSNYRGDYKDQNLKPICTQDLLCWAWQVARGMEYLSARNVLHGDLAARNILLADDNIVKICDFGLAKNMYKDNNYKKKGDGPLPIKWMAVESIRDRMFSTQSDVWSYGIVLWEFFTLARTPYPGMEAEKQYDRLIEGYRMEKPQYATDEIYESMLQCWKAKPSLRPSFPELADKIGTLLNDSIKVHYLDLNTPYIDMNTMALQNGQSDYLTMMSAPTHDYHNSPDPAQQGRPDSAYLSMSPMSKSDEPGIFSPRSELEESRFNFPPPNKTTPINSDSEDGIESAPMLTSEDPYMKPIDVQQRRAEFVKQRKEPTPVERDSGYCNVTTIPQISSLNKQSPDIQRRNSQDNLGGTKVQKKNNNKLPPPIISGPDNYVNMPQQKNDKLKDTVDSFTNPSYVIMTNLDENRQFA